MAFLIILAALVRVEHMILTKFRFAENQGIGGMKEGGYPFLPIEGGGLNSLYRSKGIKPI